MAMATASPTSAAMTKPSRVSTVVTQVCWAK